LLLLSSEADNDDIKLSLMMMMFNAQMHAIAAKGKAPALHAAGRYG